MDGTVSAIRVNRYHVCKIRENVLRLSSAYNGGLSGEFAGLFRVSHDQSEKYAWEEVRRQHHIPKDWENIGFCVATNSYVFAPAKEESSP